MVRGLGATNSDDVWEVATEVVFDVRQWPEEGTRTREKVCYWVAECEVGGVRHVARSRRGVVNELARAMVAAGLPDRPVLVAARGLAGHARWPSLWRAAGVAYQEGARPLRRERYVAADFGSMKKAAE